MRLAPADRVLVGLCVAMDASVVLVRPTWRCVHPTSGRLAQARWAYLSEDARDPWGEPWMFLPNGGLSSAGPDRLVGTDDDVDLGQRDCQGFATDLTTTLYIAAPILLALTVVVLGGTRLLSHLVGRSREGLARLAGAGVVAVPPTLFAAWVISNVRDLWPHLAERTASMVVPAGVAVRGSLYLVSLILVWLHREVGDVPPLAPETREAPGSPAPRGL